MYTIDNQLKIEEFIFPFGDLDKVYFDTDYLEKCEEDHIVTYVAKSKRKCSTGNDSFNYDKFVYSKEDDSYTCPEGNKLFYHAREKTDKDKTYYNFGACATCSKKDSCTTAKDRRRIHRKRNQDVAERIIARTKANQEKHRIRQMIVEHPFGIIKRALNVTYFPTSSSEISVAFFTNKFKRVINMLGTKKLISKL